MTEILKDGLSESEIRFCDFWSEVVKTPHKVVSGSLDTASSILGIKRSGNCSTCLRNDVTVINNQYRLLLPAYQIYLELKNVPEPEPVKEIVKKKVVKKKKVPPSKK